MVLVRYVNTFIYSYKVGNFIDYTVPEQIKDIADIFVVSILVLGLTFVLKMGIAQFQLHDLILLVTLAVSSLLMFVGIGFAIKSEKIKLVKEFI